MRLLFTLLFILLSAADAWSQQPASTEKWDMKSNPDKFHWERKIGNGEWEPTTSLIFPDLHTIQNFTTDFDSSFAFIAQQETVDFQLRCTFNLNNLSASGAPYFILRLDKMDTWADVYVNDSLFIQPNNFFCAFQGNITDFLHPEENTLRFHFPSLSAAIHERHGTKLFPYPADSEEGAEKLSPYTRKPPFHFGWDIAPRCITRGLKGITEIQSFFSSNTRPPVVSIISLTDTLASVEISIPVSFKAWKKCTASLIPFTEGLKAQSFDVELNKNNSSFSHSEARFKLEIKDPKLWWPRELGEPFLYRCKIQIEIAEKKESYPVTFGFRTIELNQGELSQKGHTGETELANRTYDEEGNLISSEFVQTDFPFTFVVNGKPLFAKGANWVPTSIDHPALSGKDKMQEYLFKQMADAGFNMVRVWGGGEYPDERFYELADSLGILVWQDFMFSGTMYPSFNELPYIIDEASEQVRRIGAHPSLALWCGNNEIQVAWDNWGWQKKYHYSPKDSLELIKNYKEVFGENGFLSAFAKAKNYPEIPYLPSSPISNWGKPEDFTKGDNHYWGVYHGEEWFSAYKTHVPRFASEYGFQSFPSVQTLREYVREDDLHLDSAAMRFRQKSYKGNGLLVKYMTHEYDFVPKRFENFVMLSQIMQGNAMKIAIEAHRSSGGHCMGSLVWQLNDCWPGITWSLIDFGGRPKSAWYEVKRAFQEQLLNLEVNDSLMQVKLIGPHGKYQQTIRFLLMNQKGKMSYLNEEIIDVNQVNGRWEYFPPGKRDLKKKIVVAELIRDGKLIDRTIEFASIAENHSLKKPEFSFVTLYDSLSHKLEITLSADVFTAHVNLTAIGDINQEAMYSSSISDNNFHLLPGEKKQISWILPEGTTEIQLMNLNDILRDRKPLTIVTL